MTRLERRFADLRKRGEPGFIAYICAGDPSLAQTEEIVYALEEAGVDVVELGVPFSDPLADGPVIQRAHERALANGVSVEDVIHMVGRLRRRSQIPIILFTYFNPVYHLGLERFAAECSDQGVDGALVLDLPPEEAGEYLTLMRHTKSDTVFLLAPTSTDLRIRKISAVTTGFIYYVSREGVTGMRQTLASDLDARIEQIRKVTDLPIAVGFGLSTPDQAAAVARVGDAVVVGSAIVREVERHGDAPDLADRVAAFVRPLVEATKSAAEVGPRGTP